MSDDQPAFDPTPRAALSRASDAVWHPTLPRERQGRAPLNAGTTSDALLGPKEDKLVSLSVEIPKSIRKALRAEAAARGMSVDALVALLARTYLGH